MCRYWLFSDVVPGLYIEKGWVHESIDYSFTLPPEQTQGDEEEEDEETEGEGAIDVYLNGDNSQYRDIFINFVYL